ncbi:ATP-binding cassette domain-containing protein [Phytohabitans sp. ZYX-F-186]|uniref:ATP-binding cassette domain-containing protein n=1 Tax=Phytohabitans maris TaxID=3071409 RepID=A0ABU0ZW64_9ACTN|nr:ATP-binding cassette domain-containing protein [Phytohabitans sp. ZYX-F-186]MDQ7911269.1 ATP-binding cassette domain-containing protein [Phytohabitans sp. ZYX-F-186]
MSLLEVRGLGKRYVTKRSFFGRAVDRLVAVDDVSFSVEAGETFAVVGESGAGKSTTGRLVLRLIEPDRGSIVFDGTDVGSLSRRDFRPYRRRMQMVFQDAYGSLDPRVTVHDSVAEPLYIHFRTGRDERLAKAAELLERVGLGRHLFDRYPGELSGGQLQRIAIARALTLNPSLIVCDEPVAALDVSIRAQVLNLMKDLQEQLGLTYLFISHDLSLVEAIADRIAVMYQGRIVEQGTVEEIFGNPRDAYTKQLLAAIPSPVPRALRGSPLP